MASSVVVVGSLNMDLVVRTPRFAAPGETIAGDLFLTVPGGKGANQAVAARRLGADVTMIGGVGDDGFGTQLVEGLVAEGVDVALVDVRAGHATGVALITVDAHGENTIVVVAGANDTLAPSDVQRGAAAIEAARVLIAQLEVPMATVSAAARAARESGGLVVLNAAPARPLSDALISRVDYLVVNEAELFLVADAGATSADAAIQSLHARGVEAVVVTLGAQGARLARRGAAEVFVPAYPVDVVDTTAAGDAFVAAFAVGLAEGRSAPEALRRGCAAGALAATCLGAQPSLPTRGDVEALIAR